MKKTIAVAVLGLALSGCNSPDSLPTPTQVPTVETSGSTANTEAPTVPPTERPEPTKEVPRTTEPEPTRQPEPSVSVTSSDAGTPATQFATRWGNKYPDIPEFAILKAANGVCAVVAEFPAWSTDPLAELALKEAADVAGIADNEVVEFTQDAQQNYCGSIANPV